MTFDDKSRQEELLLSQNFKDMFMSGFYPTTGIQLMGLNPLKIQSLN